MFSAEPREVSREYCRPEGGVAFGQIWIEVVCGCRCCVCRRRAFSKRKDAERTEPAVISRDAGVGDSVVWIECDRLLITNDCFGETFLGKGVPIEATTQVGFMCLWVVGATLRQTQTFIHGQMWN